MPNLKTTLGKIRSHDPCESGWKKLCKNLDTTDPETDVTILQILDSNGVKDAYWALRCWDYKDYCTLLADVAESVVHFYNNRYPEDGRVNKCIEAIRLFAKGQIDLKELSAAAGAAYDAYAATCDAYAATCDAAYVAYAAADAAYDADAAADAAFASVGAYVAHYATRDAAYAAADAGREKQWALNEKLMREWISNA